MNLKAVEGRTVTASPILFSLVVVGTLLWLLLAYVISLDFLTTGVTPSSIIQWGIILLTVGITCIVLLTRSVAIAPHLVTIVEDRFFGIVIHRRKIQIEDIDRIKVLPFASNWYVFVVHDTASNTDYLITQARTDSQLAMDLVLLFENADEPMKEVLKC
ncbi:hypothetical protein [Aeromonas veronii]|uniref:hypothetical protein n=1 Tax=Aeromonas veronii TaxID=654 RepID=UPI000E09BC1D|nr:hypothetical protein [Aeromonas veronii]RDE60927.1 hypothetical protein DV708_16635 [Aeromonas veronii]